MEAWMALWKYRDTTPLWDVGTLLLSWEVCCSWEAFNYDGVEKVLRISKPLCC